ncbi:MAG TPA: VTT domain-containing protein [Candidatus Angelobacter sp.]|jgi:membrane protein DedA with SNARE-associated domain|nr:VTT domain-containing protein [Candidatus Angelobacter sp.]
MHLVVGHPYLVLLASGFLERIGAPLLFSPVLVAAGALAAGGQLRFDVAVWIALATCLVGDTLWYEIGRKKGDRVLSMLCRISLEPDSCVRRSKVFFEKGSNRTLLFSKWLPGVSHVVPAVAGLSGIERQHFFVMNTAGSALWIIVLMLGGYLPVERLHVASAVGPILFEASLVALALNVGIKYVQRRQFLKALYKLRITPEEVRQMLDTGEKIVILDLRHPLDSLADERTLPGAIRVLPNEVTARANMLPRDEEIILYCT